MVRDDPEGPTLLKATALMPQADTPSERPLRVLFLATLFPKPGRETMGVWALKQAAALVRQGVILQTVSMTSWLPRFLGPRLGKYRAWADCPAEYRYGDVEVKYPRWLMYHVGKLAYWDFQSPALQQTIGWLSARRRLLRLARDFKPDVIYAHHTAMNGNLARKIGKALGIPYVITDHDFHEIESCATLPGRRQFFDPIVRDAACLTPVAKRMEATMQELFPGISTIPITNGADPPPLELARNPRPTELRGKIVILSVAMFSLRKDLPMLIGAFDRIAGKYPDAILRIVGEGMERPAVEAAVAKAAHKPQIELLGSQPHDRVLQEMAWSDLFALVGWDEPSGVVYPEAMAAGLPIVCCNDGGINDVLENEVHGLTIPPHDELAAATALDRLLGDAQLRIRMGLSGQELFRRALSWDAYAQKLLAILTRAADQCAKRPAGN